MSSADLYINEVNFLRYFERDDCAKCGYLSCAEFIEALKKKEREPRDCSLIDRNKAHAFEAIEKIKYLWPEVPLLVHPRPAQTGLVELNSPNPESLVLISGNNEYTEQVLLLVLSTTLCPFFVVFVDTDGNTVDMAMIFQTLTAERVSEALRDTGLEGRLKRREMIIPGLAGSIKGEIERLTEWKVRVGPKCAAELPLFLSEMWIPP
ncbi:MAG: (Fe-S)-binding protein [Nitrospirota bacterium]